MAKAHKPEEPAEDKEVKKATAATNGEGATPLRRLLHLAQSRPVTTLTLAAGVGTLMGAELLAAGLIGGATILLLQRNDLRRRARHILDAAQQRINDGLRTIEHRG